MLDGTISMYVYYSDTFRFHRTDAYQCRMGPDGEIMEEILTDVCRRHVKFGVKPDLCFSSGEAVARALSGVQDNWTDEMQSAWVELFGYMSNQMHRGTLEAEACVGPIEPLCSVRHFGSFQ